MVGYAEAQTAWPLIGLVIGVLIAAAIAYGMYAGAVRINLAKFFKYTGVFLILVAAGILSYGVGALQTVGWLPGPGAQGVRHHRRGSTGRPGTARSSRASSTSRPTPTVLQFVCWLAYLVVVLAFFLRPDANRPARGSRSPHSTIRQPSEPATRKVNHVNRSVPFDRSPSRPPLLAGVCPDRAARPRRHETRTGDQRRSSACRDHRHRHRHRLRAVGHRRQHRRQHFRHHQQRHQGHRVLRLRRGRAGDGRGGEHLPRPAAQADRAARRAGHLPDGVQAGHGRRRHPRRLQGHRRLRQGRRPRASSRRPPTTTSAT